MVAGVFAVFGLLLIAQSAVAADMDDTFLRGSFGNAFDSASASHWDGVYFGAQVGVANMDTDFGNEASQWVGYNLRNTLLQAQYNPSSWELMPSNMSHGQSYGAFLGYNVQWDQLVLGFDMAYDRMSSMTLSSSIGGISRTVPFPGNPPTSDTVTMGGTASLKLIDYATLRGRAGYAFGQFLPYAVLGAAVGRFNYSTAATLALSGNDTLNPLPLSDSKNNAIVVGFVGGLGMDVALLPNVFLRGEWEFVAFAPVSGIRTTLNTARVGIAVKL